MIKHRFSLFTVLLFLSGAAIASTTTKLSNFAPDPTDFFSNVFIQVNYKVSADNKYVVFRYNATVEDEFDLYSIPIGGGPRVKLNLDQEDPKKIRQFSLTPQGTRLIYTVNISGDSFQPSFKNIYSTPVAGGQVVTLNTPIPNDSIIENYSISDDGEYVIYEVQHSNGVEELFSVPSAGGQVKQLNLPLPNNSIIERYRFSIDGDYVIYEIENSDGFEELFSVPTPGGNAVKLSIPPSGATVNSDVKISDITLSNDNQYIVFSADLENLGQVGLYRSLITGGPTIKLQSKIEDDEISKVQVSPDSSRVTYVSGRQLFSVPINGGTQRKLGDEQGIWEYFISPDSKYVVFIISGLEELYSMPIDGGVKTLLSPEIPQFGMLNPFSTGFSISPDSSRVVFLAHQRISQNRALEYQLFSVAMTGGEIIKLNPTLNLNSQVSTRFIIDSNNDLVIFKTEKESDTPAAEELYSVPIKGGPSTLLSSNPADAERNIEFKLTPDGRQLIYTVNRSSDGGDDIYIRPIKGGAQTKINQTLSNGTYASLPEVSSDNDVFVYHTVSSTRSEFNLFSTNLNEEFCFTIKATNGKTALICL